MAPRGLRMALGVAVAASTADAQFLRGMFGDGVGTSSYFSSSTWSMGKDGEMHQKVQKTSSEMMDTPMGPQRVQKKMVCKDGFCREEIVVSSPEDQTMSAPLPTMPGMGFHSAREIMEQLMGRPRGAPPTSMPMPVVEIIAAPFGDPDGPPAIVEMVPPHQHPTPYQLRGMLNRLVGGPSKYGNIQVIPVPPPTMSMRSSYAQSLHSSMRPLAISCLIASSVLLATLVAALRLQQGSASAREIQTLAEPLASAEGAAPKGPAAPAAAKKGVVVSAEDSALTSTRSYLTGLYSQVVAKAEHQAITQYLSTVYTRATA